MALVGVLGCADAIESTVPPPGTATEALHSLIAEYGADRVESVWLRTAEGREAFVVVKITADRGLSEKFAIDLDGKYLSVESAQQALATEHRAAHGALSYDAVQETRSRGIAEDAELRVVVWPSVPDDAAWVASELSDAPHSVSEAPAFVSARISLARARTLARSPRVARVDFDNAPSADFSAVYNSDGPADYSDSLPNLSPIANYGSGVKVGLLEGFRTKCVIAENHEAFQAVSAPTEYLVTPMTCTNAGQCSCLGGGATNMSLCVNNRCRAGPHPNTGITHTTAVASRVTGFAAGNPRHASKVALVVSNNTDIEDIAQLSTAYDGFESRGVKLINQSFAPPQVYSPKHHLMDWIQYHRRVLIVQGNANGNIMGTPSAFLGVTSCYALNSLCVASSNAAGTYVSFLDDTLGASMFLNPVSSVGMMGTVYLDAERPDVISEGENARVASPVVATDWVQATGNSFAAPVVTGLAALMTKKCTTVGGVPPTPEQLRSMIKTGAAVAHQLYAGSSADPAYPYGGWAQKPQSANRRDGRAGVGIANGEVTNIFCGPNPSNCSTGCGLNNSGNLATIGWGALPPGLAGASASENTNVRRNMDAGSVPGPLKLAAPQRAVIGAIGALKSGDRVRTTMSFTTCPETSPTSSVRIAPKRDYDLILYDSATNTPLAVSESFDDTNEGFDVIIPGNGVQYASVHLAAVRPGAGSACLNASMQPFEPFAISTIYWRQ